MKLFFLCCCFIFLANISVAQSLKRYQRNVYVPAADETVDIYYDKDSINYPFKEKGFFGKRDNKSFVEVWNIYKFKRSKNVMKNLVRIGCDKRVITVKSILLNGKLIRTQDLNKVYFIEPNSSDERLYNILCD